MKVNQIICYLLFIFLIFVAFVYYKKQLENFKELVLKTEGDVAIESINPETGYRFKRICIGETCIDGNVLASVIDMFRTNNNSLRKEGTCSDDVCIFPQHLKHFDNSKDLRPPIIKEDSIRNAQSIYPFPRRYGNITYKGDAFRLSLSDSTDTILKDFGTDLSKLSKPLTTKILSGKICYSPGEKYPLEIQTKNGQKLKGSPVDYEFKRFRYFNYDKARNTANTLFTGTEGIYDYRNCYQDVKNGDFKYLPAFLDPRIGITTTSDLKNINLSPSRGTIQPIPFDLPQSTIGFQMGKPYDSTFVIENNSKQTRNILNQSSSQEAETKKTSSSITKPIAS